MSGNNDITAGIRLKGEQEFKAGITSINKGLSAMKSEMTLVKAECDGQQNTLESLTRKQELLNRILEEHRKKVSATKNALDHAEQSYGNIGKGLEKLWIDLEKATDKMEELEKTYGSSSTEAEEQRKVVADLNAAIEEGEKNWKKAGDRVEDWKKRLNTAQAQMVKANSDLNKNAAYMREAEEATDKCATSIDKFGKEISNVRFEDFKEDVEAELFASGIEKGLSTVTDLASTAAEKVKEIATDLSSASAKLASNTGISEDALKKYNVVLKEIRGNNYGEDYQDVADAMSQVIQVMGELDPSGMTETTESAIALRDTFGIDVNESIRAVDIMMKTMGVDATTAFNLIAKGTQNGLNRSGELTDNLIEYASLWGQAGFSAEEMFGILENGLDSGAQNLDKVNDYVKEFGVSLADGRIEENLNSFSDETKKLFNRWKDGEASTSDVFYSVINDLSEMTNKQEALTLASEVWSSLGEDNALQVITALDDVNTAYSNVQGTMDTLKETRFSNLEDAIAGLGAAFTEKLAGPIGGAAEIATGFLEGVTEFISPAKSEMQALQDEIGYANDELTTAILNRNTMVDNAEAEASRIDALGNRLMVLNDIENKSVGQKAEMSQIVNELSRSIPELASAYDEEAGKIRLSDSEIKKYIESQKELIVTQAVLTANQELINSLVEAQTQYDKAAESAEAIRAQASVYESQIAEIERLEAALADGTITQEAYTDGLMGIAMQYEDMLRSGQISTSTLQSDLTEMLTEEQEELRETEAAISTLGETIKNGTELIQDNVESAEKFTQALSDTGDSAKEAGKQTEASGDKAKTVASMLTTAAGAVINFSEEIKNSGGVIQEVMEKAAEAVEAGTQAQKDALQSVQDKYTEIRTGLEADIQNKISFFDAFNGGEDMTVEDMLSNLESQKTGLENWKANMEYLAQYVGDTISPEFYNNLLQMGTDGANAVQHMVTTLTTQGDEGRRLMKDMSDTWGENMDFSETASEAFANTQLAISASLREIGSTEVDFTELKNAIDMASSSAAEGWNGLDDATKRKLDAVFATAQAMGIKIPDGLAQGIANGEISAISAIEQLNGSVSGTFEGLLGVAEQMGIELPEDLAAGINGADTQAATDAYNRLLELILAQSGIIETESKTAGTDASSGMATGMTDNQAAVETAAETVAQAGADSISEKDSEYESAGEEAGKAFASGLESTKRDAEQAGGNVAENALQRLRKSLSDFQSTGNSAVSQYASAINENRSTAAQAGGNIASAAYHAAASYENSFYVAGYNMSEGTAEGILAARIKVESAGRTMALAALAAAKKALGIASPSKKFRKDVGQNISESTAFGIEDKASLAGTAAEQMSSQVYTKATAWLAKYKKKQKVSLEDEKYYWQQVTKHTKNGTQAYASALEKLTAVTLKSSGMSGSLSSKMAGQILGRFGVSDTQTIGSGENATTQKKDAATYYSEIYSNAERYMSNMRTLYSISSDSELAYWQQVQKQLKKGTDAWYDAQAKINEAKLSIVSEQEQALQTQANVQDSILDKYKTYYNVSAKAEMQYWNIARKQFEEGTEERIEADQKYFEAQQEWYDQRRELDEEYEKDSQSINDRMINSIRELQDAYKNAVASRKEEILSSMNLFESFDATGYDADTLLHNLRTQVAGLALWEQQLEELGKKGLAEGLLEELQSLGPQAAANIYSLNQMTAEQLEEYNKLWTQKNGLAQSQALKENADLLKETNSEIKELKASAKEELAALNTEYRAAIADLNTGISEELKRLIKKAGKIGESSVAELIASIDKEADSVETYTSATKLVKKVSSELGTLKKEGKIIGERTLDGILEGLTDTQKIDDAAQKTINSIKYAMEEAAQIHSPSRLFKNAIGYQLPAGVGEGIEEGTTLAVKSAQEMMHDTLEASRAELQKQQADLQIQAAALDYSGITRLNQLTAEYQPQTPVVNVDNSGLLSFLQQFMSNMREMVEEIKGLQMVTETGALIGEIQQGLSPENAAIAIRNTRGNRR